MNTFEFMRSSPALSFLIVYMVLRLPWKAYKQTIRHLNIRKAGWPPEWCDADGDFKPSPKTPEVKP